MLDPKASPLTQVRFLSTLGSALQKSGMPDKIKVLEARIEKLEAPAFAEYSKTALDFVPAKVEKSKSKRAVLVELFTGAMCPPCVAADLAFDALEKAFPSSDVVLLQYHLHVPGPDALSNADTEKRGEFYGRTLRGTPTIYFSGKADKDVQGGGGREDSEDKFKEYRDTALKLLGPLNLKAIALGENLPPTLQARAVRKGNKIVIQAAVRDVAKPGESTRLRLALVEDWVRYKARNGMLYHHRVVRAMPGGVAGTPITKKDLDHAVSVDLKDLRAGLHKYLDDFIKNESPFPDAQRPMRFRDLHVVAFVQHDDTMEVLQAIDVPVTEE
jgi:thiol-disulfide isomerase/thioredoxin